MKIIMTRTAARTSTTRVERDDGVQLELPSHAPLHRLPHDLAHFIIEDALGLTRGFWGSIADGIVFGGMQVVPRRRTAGIAERSRQRMRGAAARITEAEALVATIIAIYRRRLDRNWPAARVLLLGTWRPARPSRDLPTQSELHRACKALAQAEKRWLGLQIGEKISLHWGNRRTAKLEGVMRPTIIAAAFLLVALTNALAQPALPRTVDLDAPGVLEALEQTNPAHYGIVRTILAEVFLRPDIEVPRWLRASFNAQGVDYRPIVLTSHPPKRRLSFTLDDTRYVAVIVLTNVNGTIVPLK